MTGLMIRTSELFHQFQWSVNMPGKAAEVIVTETVSVSLAQRSRTILLAFDGHDNESIETLVGLQHDSVGAEGVATTGSG